MFFIFFKNVHWKYHLKSLSKQRKQIGSVWLFFFVPMLEFPYRPIYWQALLLTYRICTPLCKILNTPVMSICLVKENDGTWVEKHQRFLFNVYKRFFYFCHVFTFFNVLYFLQRFLHLWLFVHTVYISRLHQAEWLSNSSRWWW